MLNFDVTSPYEEQVPFEILAQMQMQVQMLSQPPAAVPATGPEPAESGTPGGK